MNPWDLIYEDRLEEAVHDAHLYGVNSRYKASGSLVVTYHVERPEVTILVLGAGDEATANFIAECMEYHARH